MSENGSLYRGRFAPSPTGPLHFGSLVAAVGSYLEARKRGGLWLVRMEDLDPPREIPGAERQILNTLERYGFEWDGEVIYQSQRSEFYLSVLERLQQMGLLYRCDCSRKMIAERGKELGLPLGVYPGSCRSRTITPHHPHALRLLTNAEPITFIDAIQGRIRQNLADEVGDFVLRRTDGLFAYQLAVVIDDAEQGITEVVRGSDLLDSTPRQILLQHYLGYSTPEYRHLPIAVNGEGLKLSKQTYAPALEQDNPLPTLYQALKFLGQQPPQEILEGELESFWRWATGHWQGDAVPRKLAIPWHHSI